MDPWDITLLCAFCLVPRIVGWNMSCRGINPSTEPEAKSRIVSSCREMFCSEK
jgi:hypothetical protein